MVHGMARHAAGGLIGLGPFAALFAVGVALGCSSGAEHDGANADMKDDVGAGQAGTSSNDGGSGGVGTGGRSGGAGGRSGTSGSGGAAIASGGTAGRGSGLHGGSGGGGGERPSGGAGCGLEAAAFCDTFDAPSTNRGRAGELDATIWSASRMDPDQPTMTYANGQGYGVPAATLQPQRDGMSLPACRDGLPAAVFPDDDTLICDPSSDIDSNYLLVAVASHNYGQNSYRVRQPFDFEGRAGKVVFDAEGLAGDLLGWISLDITEDPIGAPSFQTQLNFEGGVLPRSGLSIQFDARCAGMDTVGVSEVHVFDDYAEKIMPNTSPTCVPAAWGKLNHFEVSVAQDHVEVSATPFSADGTTFDAPVVIWTGDVNLPFTRGYVQFTTHNHATYKYSSIGDGHELGFFDLDAWIARWDNVGFDGPVISNYREYEVEEPLGDLSVTDANGTTALKSTGFTVADAAMGESTALEFDDVDVDGVTKASVALSAWYCTGCVSHDQVANFALRYRINGGDWVDRKLNDKELADVTTGNGRGAVGEVLDIPIDQLVAGKNTIEFLAVDIPQNYPPAIANVDLVLQTN